MNKKLRVGILGATGIVGQRMLELLDGHPHFQVTALAASDRSQGKPLGEACTWRLSGRMPDGARTLVVQPPAVPLDCDVVFSSLPSDKAGEIEAEFARAGYPVITNAAAHRMDRDVPLVIPEVNHDHFALIEVQRNGGGAGSGFIVTNPNCSTIVLSLALAPLQARFGVTEAVATTLQAISGAGHPGVSSLDITDNVLPYIENEEEKIERETLKVFGRIGKSEIEDAPMRVSAQCHRVNVLDGHLVAVRVRLARQAELEEILEAFSTFSALPQEWELHSAPKHPVILRKELDRPQPRLDRDAGSGMSVSVGRVARDRVLDYRFVALGHNTIRGAAGAALLNAELLLAQGYLSKQTSDMSTLK
jgi:aspartate-semialdehyde dehydrogenase